MGESDRRVVGKLAGRSGACRHPLGQLRLGSGQLHRLRHIRRGVPGGGQQHRRIVAEHQVRQFDLAGATMSYPADGGRKRGADRARQGADAVEVTVQSQRAQLRIVVDQPGERGGLGSDGIAVPVARRRRRPRRVHPCAPPLPR